MFTNSNFGFDQIPGAVVVPGCYAFCRITEAVVVLVSDCSGITAYLEMLLFLVVLPLLYSIPRAVAFPWLFWYCCAVYLLLLLFLVFWHCYIPGAVAVPGCPDIAVLLAWLVTTCCSWCAGIAVYLELLLFLVVLTLLCCWLGLLLPVVPGVLALLYTWSCCCSWLSWHCCAVYLLLPVVPGVLALLHTWSCCCSWFCLSVTTLVPGVLQLQYTWSCCCSWLFCHCCTVYLGLLLFLGVLALLCCLPVTNAVPGVLALLYTWSCCCSWLPWHSCAVYLLLPVVPGVLALLYTWSCCCSWLFCHWCIVYTWSCCCSWLF
jgi:hypothetical protein